MNPVYERLLEIAKDQGQEQPVPNTYFQKLLSLSSGRITQIRDPLSVAKIGAKGLSNLATLGYNPKWVNEGSPHKKRLSTPLKTQQKHVLLEQESRIYKANEAQHKQLTVAEENFINEVSDEIAHRDIPEHIRQTILTLISSSPEKK